MLEHLLDWLDFGGSGLGVGTGGLALWRSKQNTARLNGHDKKIDKTRDQVADHKTHVAEHYATNNDVRDMSKTLQEHLIRIEEKLDRKADK